MIMMDFLFLKITLSDRWGKNWRQSRNGGWRDQSGGFFQCLTRKIMDILTSVFVMEPGKNSQL